MQNESMCSWGDCKVVVIAPERWAKEGADSILVSAESEPSFRHGILAGTRARSASSITSYVALRTDRADKDTLREMARVGFAAVD